MVLNRPYLRQFGGPGTIIFHAQVSWTAETYIQGISKIFRTRGFSDFSRVNFLYTFALYVKFNPHVYVPSTRAEFHYFPSACMKCKPAEVRTGSKLRHVLRHAVSVTPPLKISRHAVIPNLTLRLLLRLLPCNILLLRLFRIAVFSYTNFWVTSILLRCQPCCLVVSTIFIML